MASNAEVRYGRDVRGILSDRCFQCHGTDPNTREAGLRLDERESAIAGRFPAIVPGDPGASELWRRVTSDDAFEVMPPSKAKKRPLGEDELAVLKRWIEAGAEYEEHWAFTAPTRPAVPQPRDAAWSRGPIDRFVLAKLEAHGMTPAPEADRATLARRVALDLTGLPPSVEGLDAFLSDSEPGAYERLVERLFTGEPYRSRMGEWLATSWLDAARYADTIGIHTDNGRQMWLWRDWVMRAFRDNMPYDQFAVEQLAGDLLPDATVDQQIASGFNRNHVATDEGGAIPEEYLVEYAVDRVSTTSSVFLGLTAGCARCHDHKYDPLTQEDFYGLVGFFNSVDEPGLYTQTPDAARAYEPALAVPSAEQTARLTELEEQASMVCASLAEPLPGEADAYRDFRIRSLETGGLAWAMPAIVSATSSDSAVTLTATAEGTIAASGPMPDFEDYVVTLETAGDDLRLIQLETLATANPDPESDVPPGAGRAFHGNAVLSHLKLESRHPGGPWETLPITWAWADHTQTNLDFEVTHIIKDGPAGWAADGNAAAGARNLLILTEQPFGAPQGGQLRATLAFRSPYAAHSLGEIRFRVSALSATAQLPVAFGRWYQAGPFAAAAGQPATSLYEAPFGPEMATAIDLGETFPGPSAAEPRRWALTPTLHDGEAVSLPSGVGATFVARSLHAPDARRLTAHVGSDDGILVFLNGEPVFERRINRGVGEDRDAVELNLRAGHNLLVLKIVNTGGPSGYAFRAEQPQGTFSSSLASALLPGESVGEVPEAELREAWRRRSFDGYRQLDDERIALEVERRQLHAQLPKTMVMRELETPRPSYLLMRGQYDLPDETRPIERRTPAFLTPLPETAPANRLGFAQWLTAADNALFARVAVNRFWQAIFGAGLVRTSADFGLQGEWPTHPELLDWLAVEFRESGWDIHELLRSIVLSSTYRQSSRMRDDLASPDPENRLLARYPSRRLGAEQIRDLALFSSGLLVEEFGGPPVKPYQPEGLWREVAMLSSNTRNFELGEGDELWRRSIYTFWKRAVPPPSLAVFDAPTRESCVIRRQNTNTPLQALVLWNDVQFVEAARSLAERVLRERPIGVASERERIEHLMRICTSRLLENEEADALGEALAAFRERFEVDADAAVALIQTGASAPDATLPPAELAAWSLIASAALSLHETLTQD